jgi:hypothetical protein
MVYAEEPDLEIQKSILTDDPVKKRADGILAVASRQVAWQPRAAPRAAASGTTPMELGVLGMTETERNRHMDSKTCALPVTSGSPLKRVPFKDKSETWVAGSSPPADYRIPVW